MALSDKVPYTAMSNELDSDDELPIVPSYEEATSSSTNVLRYSNPPAENLEYGEREIEIVPGNANTCNNARDEENLDDIELSEHHPPSTASHLQRGMFPIM